MRLEHVPVGGMLGDVAGEGVGQRLSDDADVTAGAVQRRVELDAAVVASYQQCTGSSAAPVVIASFAGPAGILVGSPKKSTWTPVRLRSRSAIRHTTLLSRSRSLSNGNGGCSPPDSGITSKPRLSR